MTIGIDLGTGRSVTVRLARCSAADGVDVPGSKLEALGAMAN